MFECELRNIFPEIIYAGAVLFGDIVVGENSTIGANALVSIDIPEKSCCLWLQQCNTKTRSGK